MRSTDRYYAIAALCMAIIWIIFGAISAYDFIILFTLDEEEYDGPCVDSDGIEYDECCGVYGLDGLWLPTGADETFDASDWDLDSVVIGDAVVYTGLNCNEVGSTFLIECIDACC